MKKEKAHEIAKKILDDRSGADFYKDTPTLARYLAEAMDISEESSMALASSINEDREGANYFGKVEALAKFLFAQM